MKTINRVAILLLMVFTFFACEKDTVQTSKEPYASLDEFFIKNGSSVQQFTMNAENGGTISGSKGASIEFPPNSFQHLNGMPATGNVTISLEEIYKKSDMMLSRISTSSNGDLLKSGGMFSLTVSQNGENLYMADGKSYVATIPASNPDFNMLPYIIAPSDSLNNTNWVMADTSTINDTVAWGIVNVYAKIYFEASSYIWSSNWLGWSNCDHIYPGVNNAPITFSSTDSLNASLQTFLVFEDNSAIILYQVNNQLKYENAPEGYKGVMVALSLKDSGLYAAFVPFTVSDGLQANFTLQPTTTEDFMADLDALN